MSICFYPWAALSVLCDGRAVTCCVDYNGVQGVGDLNVQSIKEVLEWACVGSDPKELREARL